MARAFSWMRRVFCISPIRRSISKRRSCGKDSFSRILKRREAAAAAVRSQPDFVLLLLQRSRRGNVTMLDAANSAVSPKIAREIMHELHKNTDRCRACSSLLELQCGCGRRAFLCGVRQDSTACQRRGLFRVFRIAAKTENRRGRARTAIPSIELEAAS